MPGITKEIILLGTYHLNHKEFQIFKYFGIKSMLWLKLKFGMLV